MRSRTLASGAVLLTIFGLSGIVLVQDLAGAPAPDAVIVHPQTPEPVARPAATPARVVESAGFPAVPAGSGQQQAAPAPTVTINGQPLESSWSPAASAVAEAEPSAPEPRTEVAVVPPKPIPRPAGLSVPSAQPVPAPDYEAITAAAYPQHPQPYPSLQAPQPFPSPQPQASQLVGPVGVVDGFLTYEERQRLVAGTTPGPGTEDLVQVIGPNGETLWVYPDQANQFGYGRPAQPAFSPFGILYD